MREQADAGEIVGMFTLYIKSDGTWHYSRTMAVPDLTELLARLDLARADLTHRLLTGWYLTESETINDKRD
jgi:hypothetical protein